MVYKKNNFKTIRPLLNMHRFEIRQFVRFWKLPIYSDKSNQKTNYLRNKIRKQLMPTLRILFNPQIDAVLLNFIQIRKDEQMYFQNTLNLLLKPQSCHPLFTFLCNSVKGVKVLHQKCTATPSHVQPSKAATCSDAHWPEQQVVHFTYTPTSYRRLHIASRRRCLTLKGYWHWQSNFGVRHKRCKLQIKISIHSKEYLDTFSRNQVIHWLIVTNDLVKKMKYYPNVFQKQVLKTIFKTFSQVENNSLNLKSQHYQEKLTQLLIKKFTKKLFTRQEKEYLLILLKNIISKY